LCPDVANLHVFIYNPLKQAVYRPDGNKPIYFPPMSISALSGNLAALTSTANDRQPMTSYPHLAVTMNDGCVSLGFRIIDNVNFSASMMYVIVTFGGHRMWSYGHPD